MNTFTYVIGGNIYINLTNRCSNNCDFCVRNLGAEYEGNKLWLDNEPTAQEIIKELEARGVKNYKEVVFCGYGEPMYRYDTLKEVANYVHANKGTTRINTNGQANLILGYDVTKDFGSYIDIVNVSLNATTKEKYQALCHSEYGQDSFDAMLDFARHCVGKCKRVILSVVDCIGREEIERAKVIADSVGAELRVREEIQ